MIFLHCGEAGYQYSCLNYPLRAAQTVTEEVWPLKASISWAHSTCGMCGKAEEEKWWRLHNRYLPPPLLTAGNSIPRQKLFRSRGWLWHLIEWGWMWPSLKAESLHDSEFNRRRKRPHFNPIWFEYIPAELQQFMSPHVDEAPGELRWTALHRVMINTYNNCLLKSCAGWALPADMNP